MNWASPQRGVTRLTRRAPLSHKPWIPEDYMLRGVAHLETRHVAGLALDPGLGKTSITLETFCRLQQKGMAKRMLVIAPLRVCRQVWRQEGAKWTQFTHLKFSLLHGNKKEQRLSDDADIWLINPEGIPWLAKKFFGRPLPWDVVTIDELTKFKTHDSDRSKALRPRIAAVPYKWGLTGSLAPNGYMDLFGQMLVLDGGAALGRYITHYRDNYFVLDWDGFTYNLMPGAEKRIIERIAPYWLQMSADDYLKLPPLVPDVRELDLEPPARKVYEQMKRTMIAELPEGTVTAANAAAVYAKLSQMANGAVYASDDHKVVAHIHDVKLEALEELLAELNGAPLLVAYEFNHDIDRIRKHFGDVPYLGKGTTSKQEDEWIRDWNLGRIPMMLAHPASAGHGLNLQDGSAAHICWWSRTWDLELYDQFIRRIRRRGNEAQRIFNHILCVRGTIDELKGEALRDKDVTQSRLLSALNAEIQRDAETTAGVALPVNDGRKIPMVTRLSRAPATAATAAPQQQTQAAEPARIVPKGWGASAAAATPAAEAQPQVEAQRERIAHTLTAGADKAAEAASAFSPAVQQHMSEVAGFDRNAEVPQPQAQTQAEQPATRTTRTRRAAAPAPVAVAAEVSAHGAVEAALIRARTEVLKIVFADPAPSVEEGIELARDIMAFVTEG